LARALCKQCREQYAPGKAELEELGHVYGAERFQQILKEEHSFGLKLWKAVGCGACGQSGYKGRLGLHELLVANDRLKHAIQKKAPVAEMRSLAREGGMTTLLEDGIQKVLAGQTDLKQVLAVCSR
jgi:type II secretory ATPase GspE/PulE/Tfp pilus assembly ATPase PilB-like protein